MQRFRLKGAVNLKEPLYVDSAVIRAECGGGLALTAPGSKLQHGHVYPRKGALGAQNQRRGSKGQGPALSCRTASNVVSSFKAGTSVQTWYTLSRRLIYFLKPSSQIKHLTLQVVKIKVQGKCDQTLSSVVILDAWNSPETFLPSSPFGNIVETEGRNGRVQNTAVGEVVQAK